jgi:uncharacterized membrane protein YjgN (DUF898 family)
MSNATVMQSLIGLVIVVLTLEPSHMRDCITMIVTITVTVHIGVLPPWMIDKLGILNERETSLMPSHLSVL